MSHSHHQHDGPLSGDTEDPVAAPTWSIGIAGTIVFVFCVLAVAALYYKMDRDLRKVTFDDPPVIALEQLRADQEARLDGPARLERRPENTDGQPSLVIPVDQAMDLYLAESGVPGGSGD